MNGDEDRAAPDAGALPRRIFINYRREETAGDARALYNELAPRYGAANVFLDVVTLKPGTKWLDEIKSHEGGSSSFVVLIGPRWLQTLQERAQERVVDPRDDFVRVEIEAALDSASGVTVVPVLIDDAVMPDADQLPRSLAELAEFQAAHLRHTRWDDDVAHLIEQIETMPSGRPAKKVRTVLKPPPPPPPSGSAAPGLDAAHYDELIKLMVDQGTVVPVLGSRVNASDREESWEQGSRYLPDSDELAADLARRFDFTAQPFDLARVTQYVYTRLGKRDLCRTLREILTADCDPGSVHRFLATYPKAVKDLGLPRHYQMIVTTNYDNALERAFDDAKEPYDLAVYLASGDQPGKFLHVPYDGPPQVVGTPNDYTEFPIDDSYELARTVIVKIHGAVDNARGPFQWRENYVITEDHYIDYLSRSPVESLIPVQILDKLRDCHCLFLGYSMRDWSLRVFLKRVWKGNPLDAKSWAIERDPDSLEKEFWNDLGVELIVSPLDGYASQLGSHLSALQTSTV